MKQTEKEKKLLKEIDRLLPDVKIFSSRLGNKNEVNIAHYFISTENRHLSNSEYFYKKEPNFVHFTSLLAIQAILSERNIRLYNLHNLNDPREYSFAGNLITFNNENKIDAKENFFLLSMCQTALMRNSTEIEFNMWRLYGFNGYGVAVELSFDESPPINWCDYFISEVHYGSDSRTNLKELNKLLKQLENLKPQISVDLGQLVCFHKSKLFELERETRLLFDARKIRGVTCTTYKNKDGEVISPKIKTDISKSLSVSKEIKYLELPIYYKQFKAIFDDNAIPIPKIEKIILGYQYMDNYKKVADYLTDLCKNQLGYIPKIEKSRLTKYYHDVQSST